ncbi:MAG: hypothetical protein ABJG86_16640 [Nitratireductor sp.]
MTRLLLRMSAATVLAGLAVGSAHAGARIDKIGIAREGIDLAPVHVRATQDGYAGFANNSHRFTVRLFAKGRGNNNIHRVGIGNRNGMDLIEVTAGRWHYKQRTPDDGWGVYKTSRSFTADMRQVDWVVTPGKLCRDNLDQRVRAGMARSQVLSREWTLSAKAVLRFYAAASSPSKIRNGRVAGNSEHRMATLFYPVKVVCRAR